jgi:predicted dehydrogenase
LDVLVIASPTALHGEHLRLAVDAGLATYCEKPLLWSADPKKLAEDREATLALIAACESKKIPLRLGAQWPWTLQAFYDLYPELTGQP